MRYAMTMLAGVLIGAPAVAQPAQTRCLIPSRLWDGALPLTAAATPSEARSRLIPEQPAMVQLFDAAGVHFAVPLGKPLAPGDKGGLVALHVAQTGTYRVAIQHKAWIDMVHGGKAIVSTAHAHGAPCSGIAKTVDFALARGDYMLQLSDATDDTIGVRVTRQP